MFEGSLVESRGLAVSRAQRWSAAGSAAFQLMLAALIVMVSLLRPQTMKIFTAVQHLTAPQPVVRPPAPVPVIATNEASSAMSVPRNAPQNPIGTRHFSPQSGLPVDDGAPGAIEPIMIGGGGDPMAAVGPVSGGPAVTVARPASIGPVNVSRGVSEGMLLAPIRPVYPHIAIVTRTQGAVIVEAIISKTGKIESEHVVSGPPMLRQAALEAISAAHYRPYLLSGDPVEVQTTITVVFKLGE